MRLSKSLHAVRLAYSGAIAGDECAIADISKSISILVPGVGVDLDCQPKQSRLER
jgi:hypothetical protein